MVLNALNQALATRQTDPKTRIYHSERGVLGGFNRLSQQFDLYFMLGIGPVLRRVFSNQAFSRVGYLVCKQLHPNHLGGAG